ncbi:MAG TPA: DUF2079 domain-containing protein [Planctomicrobium sp.]|nr:DUF2079 domain-containing protein [Planctomicrobium sp.]
MPQKIVLTEPTRPVPVVLACLLLQIGTVWLFFLFAGENNLVAGAFVSRELWLSVVSLLGADIIRTPESTIVSLPIGVIGFLSLLISTLVNGAPLLLQRLTQTRDQSKRFLPEMILSNTYWTLPLVIWSVLWIMNFLIPGMVLSLWLIRSVQIALAVTLAGWLWETIRVLFNQNNEPIPSKFWNGCRLCVAMGIVGYVVLFVVMNFGLWFNLQIPHGDSAMYEQHLWNTLTGRGFRSDLDQGLFLGEHVQVIHLLLLPIYALWRSHLCLEFFGSVAIATGAIPVFLLAKKYGRSEVTAMLVALAWLFAFPVQYLDIAIDLKTFRPSAFGIPAMLFGILAMESRRWGWMAFCFLIALASQEDFAIVIAPLGLWLAIQSGIQWRRQRETSSRNEMIIGGAIAIAATVYVFAVVKVIIPWFRSGVPVHYVSYFEAFGNTPYEIVWNLLTRPDLVWRELVTAATFALFLYLIIPFGMPYRAWSRLLVGLPLFVLLAANQLTRDYPGPFHHFHAPILPVLAWAACAHIGIGLKLDDDRRSLKARERGLWILCCAMTTGLFFSLSPFGIKFWDSGSTFYWKRLYVQDERAREFTKVLSVIPTTARVASTDFVHPRFTHYERSYDYSHYPRRVANYEDRVPHDTDYIVIDTQHRYSEIRQFEEMREYQNQRDQWEVVPIDTKGYFLVLKRIQYPEEATGHQEEHND